MSMFEELFVLARTTPLTMTLTADAASGCMTINVLPKLRQDAHEPVLAQALSLTATPQEFDAGFVDALRNYRAVRLSLAQQAEATQAVIEAARVASAQKANGVQRKIAKAAHAPVRPAQQAVPAHAAARADDEMTPSEDGGDGAEVAEQAAATSGPAPLGGPSYDLFG
jgi:PRTRC genetic system protein E